MTEENSAPVSEAQAESAAPSLQDIALRHATPPEAATIEAEEPEAPEAVAEAPQPKRDPAAARFGALAKKERELRNQMASFDNRMKEFEARENAIKEREFRFQTSKRPTEKLKELGFTYADLTQDLIGNYKEPEVDPLDEKLKPFKENWDKYETANEKLAEEVRKLQEQISLKDQKEVYGKVMADINTVLEDGDKYELTVTMGKDGTDLIQEVILEYFNENEILLDYSAACDIVEQYYEDQVMAKVAGTKKLKSRFAPQEQPKAAPKQSQAPKESSAPKTLTQAHTTGTQATIDVDKMSKSEALAYLSKKILYKQD
mgnify:CR=1 FL=1|tara:strand:+ start:2115 stop:3062 length:948 start_codon:yes stop_codon:yes gene_type:complete